MTSFTSRFFEGMTAEAALLLDANAERGTARVYNYLYRSVSFRPRDNGLEASIDGFGAGLKVGDFILKSNSGSGSGQSRYRITRISYPADPGDQWFAEAVFDRRTVQQMDYDAPFIAKRAEYWEAQY